MRKIGIWIPILGIWFLWREATSERKYENIHQFTLAAMLNVPYTVILLMILVAKHMIWR